jgi:hypothetical protein
MSQNLICATSSSPNWTSFSKKVCVFSLFIDIHNLSIDVECIPFIDTLFTVLRTKSYLPYGQTSPASSLDTGIPIPLDALLSPNDRSRKRSIDNDERDGRPPTKGPRLSADGTFSRYNGRNDTTESRSTGGWGHQHQNGRQSQPYRPPDIKRGICRDYHSPYSLSLTRATTLIILSRPWLLCPRCLLQVQSWRRCRRSRTALPNANRTSNRSPFFVHVL